MSLKCSHTLHSGLEIRSSQSHPQHLHHSTPSDDLIRADNLCECRARPHPPGAADFPGALAELAGAKIPSAEETPPVSLVHSPAAVSPHNSRQALAQPEQRDANGRGPCSVTVTAILQRVCTATRCLCRDAQTARAVSRQRSATRASRSLIARGSGRDWGTGRGLPWLAIAAGR